jgi:carbamoyl-phosphate synthase large subunit
MDKRLNVLFTSAGRRIELLRSFREAYAALGLSGRIVAVDIDSLAPALRMADQPYLVPRLDSPEYVPALSEILRRERIDVVFPLIDPDVPMLARHREELESTGARLVVVPLESAEIAADKWRTRQFLRRLDLPVPGTWLPGQLNPAGAEYPLFVKPRFGSASQGTFQAANAEELEFFSRYVPDPIIQEFLPGPEITTDVTCDLDGNVLAVVSRQRIRVRSGEVLVGKTVFDRGVTDACVRIAQGLQAIGPINVQCMMKDNAPKFIEINARAGGGMPLGIAAGADWPRWLLARAAGIPVEIPPLGSYHHGLYLSRFDQSAFVTEDQLVQIPSYCDPASA